MACRLLATWCALALLCAAPALAAPQLSLDEVFASAPPWGAQPSNIRWSPDGASFLYVLPWQDPEQPTPVRQYDVNTGQSRVVIDPEAYGGKPRNPGNVAWSPDGKALSFVIHGTLYVRDMSTGLDRTIAKDVSDVLWSPQSTALAYTHGADLYVAALRPVLRITRMTTGGIPGSILNGDVDWVYAEEFSTVHGFAWSPDGRFIAYVQMDERPVTNYPIVDFTRNDNSVAFARYPLAGERNPRLTLHVVDVATAASRQLYDAGARDEYLPSIAWQAPGGALIAELLDRAQRTLRVVQWQQPGYRMTQLYRQTGAKWVDAIALPQELRAGRSLWVLERDNVPGLYLRSRTGKLKRLNGAFRVVRLLGVDEDTATAYVSAAYPTRRDRSLLAVPLTGGAPANLTPSPGTHSVALAPTNAAFVDTYSTLNDPPQTELISLLAGTKAILAPRNESLREQLLRVQTLSVDSAYGKLDAYMIRPAQFDPARRYPVVVYVYGGPELPTTADAFGYMLGLYQQLLARRGFIVFSIDGPASQIDDEAHVRLLYHNLGAGSLLGQEIGAAYLRSLPYVDGSRIGIWGWSFGGYETAYALTHSASFKAGAAGAPVTDWRLYDSIYTERYMGSPQDDPKSYDAASVIAAAAALRGALLVSQGTADDNVHMANSIALLHALIAADKPNVDFMPYSGERHGFTALSDLRRLYESMLDWWSVHL